MLTGDVQGIKDLIREEKKKNMYGTCLEKEEKIKFQDFLSEKYGNIPAEPIHMSEITEETLEIAADIHFIVVTCPFQMDKMLVIQRLYNHRSILTFYKNLLRTQSLETALKSLARILYVMVNENGKVFRYEDYNIARALFEKTTALLELKNRDIFMTTTPASEIELFEEQATFRQNPNKTRSIRRTKVES